MDGAIANRNFNLCAAFLFVAWISVSNLYTMSAHDVRRATQLSISGFLVCFLATVWQANLPIATGYGLIGATAGVCYVLDDDRKVFSSVCFSALLGILIAGHLLNSKVAAAFAGVAAWMALRTIVSIVRRVTECA